MKLLVGGRGGGVNHLNPFLGGGGLRCNIWTCYLLLKLIKEFLVVVLLIRSEWDFRCETNGVNGGSGCHHSDVGGGLEWVLVLLM